MTALDDSKPHGRIYCITNSANGKRYVGQTVKSLRRRLLEHLRYNTFSYGKPSLLSKAALKHGEACFSIVELAIGFSQDELNSLEAEWIARLGTVKPAGYNLRSGGNQSAFHADTKAKISRALRASKVHAQACKSACARPDVIAHRKAAAAEFTTRPDWIRKNIEHLENLRSDPACLAKIADARKIAWRDPIYRQRTRAAMIAGQATPSAKKNKSDAQKAKWARDGYREKMSAAIREACNAPKTKEKWAKSMAVAMTRPGATERRAATTKSLWASADYRAAWEMGMLSIDKKARGEKKAAAMRVRWQDPTYRDRVLAARRASALARAGT